MSLKILEKLFSNTTDPRWIRVTIRVILVWYIFDTLFFFLIGVLIPDLQAVFTGFILLFWVALTALIFRFSHSSIDLNEKFKWIYLPVVFVLAVIEETIIYFNGGGLGGAAQSLQHDLLLAVPVFLGIAVGIVLLNAWKKLYSGEFFLLGAIQGFIIEIIFTGNILGVWLFGGAALGIYGAMMGALTPKIEEDYNKSAKSTIIILVMGIIICFICIIIGAIIGDTLFQVLGP